MHKISIIVQARSTSKRFPNKILEKIGERPMLKCVLDACKASADYLNSASGRNPCIAQVALVIPTGDAILSRWRTAAQIFEGPEEDVLTRYVIAAKALQSDYICRITSDCPLIPAYLISKHIRLAQTCQYDYISNVDPRFRTSPDGWDCEVLSKRMLQWLDENANHFEDREHVTSILRTSPPQWARLAHTIGFIDSSNLMISVNTQEELEQVRKEHSAVKVKVDLATEYFGKEHVHRF